MVTTVIQTTICRSAQYAVAAVWLRLGFRAGALFGSAGSAPGFTRRNSQGLFFKIFYFELPLLAFAEGCFKALCQHALFFEVDITSHIAGTSADGARISVLCGGIEINVAKYPSGGFGSDLCLAADDSNSVLEILERIGRHKGILETVCTVIVYGTLPGVNGSVLGDRLARATLYALTALVAKMRLLDGRCLELCIGQYEAGADGMGDDWYQVGELYEGTAPILSDGTIDYKNWIATHKNYEIADGIAYLVGAPNGDQYDIMKTMEQLISAEDQDIFNQIDNVNIFKKTYDIIMKHQGSDDPAIVGLRTAFYDAEKFYVNHNNGQEFKVVRNKYTRAEIIYALRNIQDALDYYYQVYGNS